MVSFIIVYLAIGFCIGLIFNILYYVTYKPLSEPLEVLAILLLWPTVLTSFINCFFDTDE